MTLDFDSVYVAAAGAFLPGEPVANDAIHRFIAPLDARSARIQRRILADNGIKTRHYAIDEEGQTRYSAAQMAVRAIQNCLAGSGKSLSEVDVLCTGSSGGDLALPGFANMVQGELGAPPMHTSSHHGVCASTMVALQHAASALSLGNHRNALVVGSEIPSRMFKRSRFAPRSYHTEFDSHFLRFMLSDGAGAWLLSRTPRAEGLSLKLDWVHTRSFSGDQPVCMQIGSANEGKFSSYLDYPSLKDAEEDGAFLLRQDIRLLPRLFELGIHEYIALVREGRITPSQVDRFLCHYSSKKFEPIVDELMSKAGLAIPKERWYSNLVERGNTGAASILVMLADMLREHPLQEGQRILCFVPESGRFTISFAQLRVVAHGGRLTSAVQRPKRVEAGVSAREQNTEESEGEGCGAIVSPPHEATGAQLTTPLGELVQELAVVWHDYQSRLWRTPLVRKINQGTIQPADYVRWMESWIPQVRYGSHWMRRAGASITAPFEELSMLISQHARDEQEDYAILFEDYRCAGGRESELDALRRNPGGEALNSFMFSLAERPNPVGLLGAIYIIEGTGQRVIPALLPSLRARLELPERAFRFLKYHGENDEIHLARWLRAVEIVLRQDPSREHRTAITETARATTELYLLQFRYAL